MIKLIILVIIIIFIILPLYKGETVEQVIGNIRSTINAIKQNTPDWVQDLVIKILSISVKLIKAIFNAVINVIFQETKESLNQKIDQKKEQIKEKSFPGLFPSQIAKFTI